MRSCRLLSLALAGLLAFAHASRAESEPRAEKAFEPTAVLRLAPLDCVNEGDGRGSSDPRSPAGSSGVPRAEIGTCPVVS